MGTTSDDTITGSSSLDCMFGFQGDDFMFSTVRANKMRGAEVKYF